MTLGCIYYTDFHANKSILLACQEQLKNSFSGEIVSVTLNKPLNLGRNIVLKNEVRSYPTMVKQILIALEASQSDYVFFTESDVLYHPSHFDFKPPADDKYYYNLNNWRWDYPNDRAIQYDGLTSLSMMCCNRQLAINHYRLRTNLIKENGLDKIRSREPRWARRFGYEPGTKPKRRGGVSDEKSERWWSESANIDIRHKGTFSSPKTRLEDFKHQPKNWKEVKLSEIPYWDLRSLLL